MSSKSQVKEENNYHCSSNIIIIVEWVVPVKFVYIFKKQDNFYMITACLNFVCLKRTICCEINTVCVLCLWECYVSVYNYVLRLFVGKLCKFYW